MKKLINDRHAVVDEMIEGFLWAHRDRLWRVGNTNGLVRKGIPRKGRVSVLIGGGSGHEPLFIGFVGPGMGDAVAPGNVFAAPPPDLIHAATRAADGGAGVVYVYGNYAGDIMNFDMAAELAEADGIEIRQVRIWDDVASAPPERMEERRGVSDIFTIKTAGAMAERGASLDEVARTAGKARDNTRSVGVALSSATHPITGEATFQIGADEIEVGMGLHGEPGVGREKLKPADEVARHMVELIIPDLPFRSGDEVVVTLSSLGSTTQMELYIMYRKIHELLESQGIRVYGADVGTFSTCQEMAGCHLSLTRLDEELKEMYDAPAASLSYCRG